MFKKDKTTKSDKSIEKGLYAKTFLKAFGIGFISSMTNVSTEASIIIGSAALNSGDLAKGEFKSTLKTAGLVTVSHGVLRGVVSGVKSTKYLKDAIAQIPDDITEVEVVFEEED